MWTTIEAQLAVICASAPSLKVFFNRYLTQYTTRTGYTGELSRGNSPDASRLASNVFASKHSQSTTQQSQIRGGDAPDEDIPLGGIHVNHKLQVKVEERDDVSQKSFASTKALTSLPEFHQGWRDRVDWAEGYRSVRSAFQPGSRGPPTRQGDVEAGHAT